MLSAKAYNQAYGYREYREAKDYSDLLTAFANDLQQVESNYVLYGYPGRKKKFDSDNREQTELHSICAPVERHIDIAFEHLRDWLILPTESQAIQRIFDKRIEGWNDTYANRLENKIDNSKAIIKWFQDKYPIILRRSFYLENESILQIERQQKRPFRV